MSVWQAKIHGSVGAGKTMMLDMFHGALLEQGISNIQIGQLPDRLFVKDCPDGQAAIQWQKASLQNV